jgi:poly(hydroxyalkanoate) depolymerase family esterase
MATIKIIEMHEIKNLPTFLLLFCSLICNAQKDLVEIKDFGNNPGNLGLYIHLPKVQTKKMALVVALHGCNQSPETISKIADWNKLADENGFCVIYPRQKFVNNISNCFMWYSSYDISKNSGESGSIKRMIGFICDSYPIDTSRIFGYGVSAGAAMTAALLADYPETFNAGAILAGGPFMAAANPKLGYYEMSNAVGAAFAMKHPKHRSSQEWGEYVVRENPTYKNNYPRMIIMHGKDDNVVDFENANQLVKQWAYVVQTDTIPTKTTKDFANNKNVEKNIFLDKNKEEKIIFYEITGIGHALPIDPGDAPDKGGKADSHAIDIDFFSTYWIAKDFGLVK